jgi:hypothetical protein
LPTFDWLPINGEPRNPKRSGAIAFASSYTAYFPASSQGIPAKVERISAQADLATLKLQTPASSHTALLEIDDRSEASVTGDPVVLIGYPGN